MTVALVAAVLIATAAMFTIWVWVMDRVEEREERAERERMRRSRGQPTPHAADEPRHLLRARR